MQIAIPSATEPVVYQEGKATNSWFTFFENAFRIVGGNYGITLTGNLNLNTTSASNSGSGETDLISYTLPADTLVNDGDEVIIKVSGKYAANANNKTVKLYFGNQVIFNTGAVAANNTGWVINATIVRTSATTQEIEASAIFNNSASATRTAGTQTLSSSNVIKCTGQGSANNDITQYISITKLTPNI